MNKMINLPSKKFISTTSAILIVFVLIYVVSYVKNKKANISKSVKDIKSINENKVAFNTLTEKDSDNDGLKNWEEKMWGTDPNNSDSDGDGTPDGEEVLAGRNPTIPGPNDKIDAENKNSADNSKYIDPATKNFSDQFFLNIAYLKQSGELNDKTISNLSDSLVKKLAKDNNKLTYKISDIKITSSEDAKSIRLYGNELGKIAQKYLQNKNSSSKIGKELTIIQDALTNNNNKDKIKELEPIISEYRQAGKDMLNIKVPIKARLYHLSIMNSLNKISNSLSAVSNIFDDPLRGLSGISKYRDETIEINDVINRLKDYFEKNKIQFKKDDPGYIFTKQK